LYIQELSERSLFIGKSTLFQVALQYRLDGQRKLFVPKFTKNTLAMLKQDFLSQRLFLRDTSFSRTPLLKK
jgi:hypothetical protein